MILFHRCSASLPRIRISLCRYRNFLFLKNDPRNPKRRICCTMGVSKSCFARQPKRLCLSEVCDQRVLSILKNMKIMFKNGEKNETVHALPFIGWREGFRLSRLWKNSLSSVVILRPGVIGPGSTTLVLWVIFLAGCGFLKSCFGICPKLLIKPMVAFFFKGSSMLERKKK